MIKEDYGTADDDGDANNGTLKIMMIANVVMIVMLKMSILTTMTTMKMAILTLTMILMMMMMMTLMMMTMLRYCAISPACGYGYQDWRHRGEPPPPPPIPLLDSLMPQQWFSRTASNLEVVSMKTDIGQ